MSVTVLAVVFLVRGELVAGLVGIALGVPGYGGVVLLRPRR